ncbi:MAG: hypothetical protein JW834_02065 [Candidatus Diapherotrites archaeon]|nr:hypothetical protein [Candidatus Diapherotrites archaeon]
MKTCDACGKEVTEAFAAKYNGGYVYACSEDCKAHALEKLPFEGRPLQSWSRITGYLQSIDGWNKGKLAELKDRYRNNNYFPEQVKEAI